MPTMIASPGTRRLAGMGEDGVDSWKRAGL